MYSSWVNRGPKLFSNDLVKVELLQDVSGQGCTSKYAMAMQCSLDRCIMSLMRLGRNPNPNPKMQWNQN